jgi:hypothetical protein
MGAETMLRMPFVNRMLVSQAIPNPGTFGFTVTFVRAAFSGPLWS